MGVKPDIHVLLMIVTFSMLVGTVFGGAGGQVLLVDDATFEGDGSGEYEFEVLSENPAVIGVRPLSGGSFDIEAYEDTAYEDLIESSESAGGAVNFIVLDGGSLTSPPNLGAQVTSGPGSYVTEMENEIDRHPVGTSFIGSMDRPRGGPVLNFGSPGSWDDEGVYGSSVVYNGEKYHMWYTANDGGIEKIGYATSTDGIEWVKDPSNPVLVPEETWEIDGVGHPSVLYVGGIFHMWYTGNGGTGSAIGYATSPDGIDWTKYFANPVLERSPGYLDANGVSQPSVLYNGTIYHMWYAGYDGSNYRIFYAYSMTGIDWTKIKNPLNPPLEPTEGGHWDNANVCGPSVVHDGSIFHMWYGGDHKGNKRIGYATSNNGVLWTKFPTNPVLDVGTHGSWDDTHITGPAVLQIGSTYRMWYSGHDGKDFRIGYASTEDVGSWAKFESSPEVLDVYVVTNIIEDLTYTIELDVPPSVDLNMYIFRSTGGRDDALASSTTTGPGIGESITFSAPISGEYILVITNENGGAGMYTVLTKSAPTPNIVGNLVAGENGAVSFRAEAYYPGLTENTARHPAWPVDISADGRYLAVGWNSFVTLFSTASNIPLWSLDTGVKVSDLKLSDDGKYLAVLGNKTLYFFHTDSNIPLWSYDTGYRGGIGPGNLLDMTREGRFVACKAWGNRVVIFDTTVDTPEIPYWDHDFGDQVEVIKFSGDGRYLAMGGFDSHELQLGWIPERSINWTYSNDDVFYSVSFSHNGSKISFGQGIQHNVGLLSSTNSSPDWIWELDGTQYEQVMSDDGTYFASGNQADIHQGSWSGFALWDSSDSEPIWEYQISQDRYSKADAIDMDRNAHYVVGGCNQNMVFLFSQLADGDSGWSPADGAPIFTYITSGRIICNGVTISADGSYFAAASYDGTVYLFSTLGGPHLMWTWDSSSSYPASVEYSWDFDASVDSDGDGDLINDEEATVPNPTHVYDRNGFYTVTLTLTAEDGSVYTYSLAVNVNNFAPTVIAGLDQVVDEGEIAHFAGTITDPGWPDPFTIVWDFGDGGSDLDSLNPMHTYGDDGVYAVTLKVTDGDWDSGLDIMTVTVNNVAPTVNAGFDQTADEGDTVYFSGSFTDPGWLDTHTVEWDFGDGFMMSGTLTPEYTYGDNGLYTVTLKVTDDDGGIGIDTLIVTVDNVAPSVDAGPDQTVDEGITISFDGSFTDPGWLDTHTVEWDFGIGSKASGTLTPTHVYRKDGVYTITLKVTDDDGMSEYDTLVVTVNSLKSTPNWTDEFFKFGLSLSSLAIIAALLVSSFLGGTEVGKYRLIPIISPLYSRLKKEEVLDHFMRGRIFEHIRKNPGDHYNNIKQELGLNNGSLAYHLHTLEKEEFIKSRRDGIYKRFYPTGMEIPERPAMQLSPMEKEITGIIQKNPGIIQKEISKTLKLSQQIVSYHVNLMIDSGLLRAERHGKTFRYFCN